MKGEDLLNIARDIAWRAHRRCPSVEVEELISEAVLQACICLKKWDPERGKFCTFAYKAVFNKLMDFCRKDITYRHMEGLPESYSDKNDDVFMSEIQKLRALGFTLAEISEITGINEKKVRNEILKYTGKSK